MIYYDSSGGEAAHLATRPALLCSTLLPSIQHSFSFQHLFGLVARPELYREGIAARPPA